MSFHVGTGAVIPICGDRASFIYPFLNPHVRVLARISAAYGEVAAELGLLTWDWPEAGG